MKKVLFFMAVSLGLLACTEKNNPTNPTTISCNPTSMTVDGSGGEFLVKVVSKAAWSASANKSWVNVSPESGQGDGSVIVTIDPGAADNAMVTFSTSNESASLVIKREGVVYEKGTLPGKFSVNSSAQVQFSQGNLQYNASTQTWRFAEHQYDTIGEAKNGWIDLFGWGTGGYPTQTSKDNSDYSWFQDWGVNPISNGGNQADLWRTLTKDEWVYLFCERANASTLFGLGRVSGICGTIILPDNWSTPQGVSFTPSTSKGLVNQNGKYINANKNNFSHNTYSANQWSIMEASGAVFLPTAGYRDGDEVSGVNWLGHYWSSTPRDTDSNLAEGLGFNAESLYPKSGIIRFSGSSVRLVR